EADPASRSAAIDGIIALMEVRGLINELNNTSEFHPSPDWPGAMVVVDEFHEASAQNEHAGKGRLDRLAREGRAVGQRRGGGPPGRTGRGSGSWSMSSTRPPPRSRMPVRAA